MFVAQLNREVPLEQVNGFISFIDFARDVNKTECVFDIAEAFRNTESYQLATEYMKAQPGVRQLVQERYLATTPDLDALLQYPQDSLGYIYASKMKKENLDPNFYRKVIVEDDATYLALRLRQTHDIWHAVTGFGTDVAGELALQAFLLAQTHGPIALAIIAAGLLNTLLKSSEQLTLMVNSIHQGYNMGLNAKPFLAQKWEEGWDKSLAEWRAELGVEPLAVSAS